jgi:anaphase-promoting complex subunit 5
VLLALVELYAESRFPNASVLPVVSFVIKHLVHPKDSSSFVIDLEDIKTATATQPSAVVGRTIYDLLLKRLWEINSFDALQSFFTDILSYIADPEDRAKTRARGHGDSSVLHKTSILGCFLRRASLEFTRLQFHDAIALWHSFVRFREPTLNKYKQRNIGAGPTSFDVNLKGLPLNDPVVRKIYFHTQDTSTCASGIHNS